MIRYNTFKEENFNNDNITIVHQIEITKYFKITFTMTTCGNNLYHIMFTLTIFKNDFGLIFGRTTI